MEGHSHWVTSVVAIDEKRLASASDDKTIKLWNIQDGSCIRTMEGHSDVVTSVVTIDEKRLASASKDKTIKLWNIQDGSCVSTMEGHSDVVTSVAAINEKRLASASDDNTIKLWNIQDGSCISTLEEQGNWIPSVVTIDEKRLASGSDDNTIKLWDIQDGSCIRIMGGHSNWVTSVATIDEKRLASASDDNTIKLWDIQDGSCIRTMEGHSRRVTFVVTIDEKRLASGSFDKTIKLWDIQDGSCLRTMEGHFDVVASIVAIDEKRLASASHDKTIKLWNIQDGSCISTLEGHSNWATSVVTIDEKRLASGSLDSTIKLWDIETGRLITSIPTGSGVLNLAHGKMNTLIGGLWNGTIVGYDLSDISNIKTEVIVSTYSGINALNVRDEGKQIFFANYAGDMGIIELKKIRRVKTAAPEIKTETLKLKLPIKALLIGNSDAGKTTFAWWLVHNTFKDDIRSTHGMRFFNLRFPDAKLKSGHTADVEFNIWDFGGQPEYQLAHQQNYDKTRLILFAVDLGRKESEDDSNNFWIDRLKEHQKNMHPDLKIYLIGTRTNKKNTARLERIKAKIIPFHENVKCLVIDVKTKKNEFFIKELKTFLEEEVELSDATSFSRKTVDMMDIISRLQEREAYFYYNPQNFMEKSNLGGKDTFSLQGYQNAVDFLVRTGKIEILENKKITEAPPEMSYRETMERGFIERALKDDRDSYDMNSVVLLRTYWKFIAATTLLQAAYQNPTVSGALAEHTLFRLDVPVEFDRLYDGEEIIEHQLLAKARKDPHFMQLFTTEIARRLIRDHIAYRKLGMFVFPSRFPQEKCLPPGRAFRKVEDIKLTYKNNVEETIAVLVNNIFYSDRFIIEKHLFDGVTLRDHNGDNYYLQFHRHDHCKEKEKEIQPTVTISVYTSQNVSGENQLLEFLYAIMEKHLTPLYKQTRFQILEKGDQNSPGNPVGSLHLETTRDTETTLRETLESLETGNLVIRSHEDNNLPDIRLIHTIEEKQKTELDIVKTKLEDFYKRKKNLASSGETEAKTLTLLHLSDLHFSENTPEEQELDYLLKNLDESKRSVDFIVISGDLTAGAVPGEFVKISRFLSGLCRRLDVPAERLVIVPGNHDYSREITHNAYTIRGDENLEKEDFRINEKLYLKRDGEKWKNKFNYFSEYLYEYVYNKNFSRDKEKQTVCIYDKDFNIAFIMLNTAADIDQFSLQKTYFDTGGLNRCAKGLEATTLKIAVGHHPLDFCDDTKFIENLQYLEFAAYLHGHVHRDISIQYGNPQYKNDRMMIIGANTFSVSPGHRWPGTPLRYNLITVTPGGKEPKITVTTRQRPDSGYPWKEAFIYYDKETGKPTDTWSRGT